MPIEPNKPEIKTILRENYGYESKKRLSESDKDNQLLDSICKSDYDGYAECVRTEFDQHRVSVARLVEYLFEIIDPYSLNKQGPDIGPKYRTGIYSKSEKHLQEAKIWIGSRENAERIKIEVLPLTSFVPSDPEHQNRLTRYPNEKCHIPRMVLHKYRAN